MNEFYRLSGWETINLEPRLRTPNERVQAVATTAQSGAKALEILVMSLDEFEGAQAIHESAEELSHSPLATMTNTRNHLVSSLENMGMVQIEEGPPKKWRLTQFGDIAKPALIFTWQKSLEAGVTPTEIFDPKADGKRGVGGKTLIAAALSRTLMLKRLLGEKSLTSAELRMVVGFGNTTVLGHLGDFRRSGLVTFSSNDNWSSHEVLFFTPTEEALQEEEWPGFRTEVMRRGKHTTTSRGSELVRKIQQAMLNGDTLSISALKRIIEGNHKSPVYASEISRALNHLLRTGRVKRVPYDHGFSDISLTEKGDHLVRTVIDPLIAWSIDPYSVPEIRNIAVTMVDYPDSFQDLYHQMAEIFLKTSPGVQRGLERKISQIRQTVAENDGELMQVDISRRLGLSGQTINRGLAVLMEQGAISLTTGENGRTKISLAQDTTGTH